MTDRIILYPGSVPLETDTMFAETGAMVGLGYLAQMILGAGSVADGLACTPTAPASLTVNVGPGSIATLATVDATAMSSQAANSAPLVKLGINLTSTAFTFAAPGTAGQSINYLIEAQMLESDGDPLALSYYNATNPALPYVGPSNSGSAQNTQRTQRVSLQVKNGTAATTGTQVTPGVDAGWSGLWVVTVNYGQTQITSSSIALYPGAPFVDPSRLNQGVRPGRRIGRRILTGSGTYVPTAGTNTIVVTCIGGGGGGSGAAITGSGQLSTGGGGGGGGLSKKTYTSGFSGLAYSVGAGGVGFGGTGGANYGTAGGNTTFGSIIANGGGAATAIGPFNSPAYNGTAYGIGAAVNLAGSPDEAWAGNSSMQGLIIGTYVIGGIGGAGPLTAGSGQGGSGVAGLAGGAPGAGGGGSSNNPSMPNLAGGAGAAGVIYVDEFT